MNQLCRLIGPTVAALAVLSTVAKGDDKAPPAPPINPVSPGTSVDGQGATVKLDPDTMLALRQMIVETVRVQLAQSQPPPSGQTPYQGPTPSPQGYYPPPPVAQAPVTPVVMMTHKSLFHRGMGSLGAKLQSFGQPTVTQGVITQSVTPVTYVQTVKTKRVAMGPEAAIVNVPYPVSQAPAAYVPLATPQAPRK